MDSANLPCDCQKRAVRGLHECHWEYLLKNVWIARGELKEGDAFVTDNLACHHNLQP